MKTNGSVTIAEIKNALAARRLDHIELDMIDDGIELDVDVSIDADDVASGAGYVKENEIVDDLMSELEADIGDLRDGLKALMDGDRHMASILLIRALAEWPAAARAVEDTVRGHSRPDPRQLSLLAA